MYRMRRSVLVLLAVIGAGFLGSAPLTAAGQASSLSTADAKGWIGEWVLALEGGRGPQERTVSIRDMGGKVAVTFAGGRGGPIEVADVSKKGNDLVLKFKQQGRGGEVDVVSTLSMQGDGSLKVNQQQGQATLTGTGKKK